MVEAAVSEPSLLLVVVVVDQKERQTQPDRTVVLAAVLVDSVQESEELVTLHQLLHRKEITVVTHPVLAVVVAVVVPQQTESLALKVLVVTVETEPHHLLQEHLSHAVAEVALAFMLTAHEERVGLVVVHLHRQRVKPMEMLELQTLVAVALVPAEAEVRLLLEAVEDQELLF
jgi:hypothetical protein